MTARLRIGDIATQCGVTRDTIRFYERAGLLDRPSRTPSHHRLYDGRAVERVRFIRQLQNCGLTIGDIHELVLLEGTDRAGASKRLMAILRYRLEFIEERVAHLESCRDRLTETMRRCAAARGKGYDVLSELAYEDDSPAFRFGRRGVVP